MLAQSFTLNTGQQIPSLGFGTWQLQGSECYNSVRAALEFGYKHIDTAKIYGNHDQVAKAIRDSTTPREEIFLTSKLWRDCLDGSSVLPALENTLEELETDYLDLYLIHWPSRQIPIAETFEQLEKAKEQGKIKAFGVSNFTITHLQEALKTGISFANNQVEFHPTLNQSELLKFCQENEIVLTAYSPVGRGYDLKLPQIQEISQKHDRSPSQVILNWIISKGIVAIPKASKAEHIMDNLQSLNWQLPSEDIEKIDQLDQNNRLVNPSFAEF